MSTQDNGGPAFGYYHPDLGGHTGMTLRDYFAAKVVQGLLSCDIDCSPDQVPVIAEASYAMADAMLKARQS